VGRATAAALAKRRQDVVVISRHPPVDLPGGVTHLACDVRDVPALTRACEGAHVLYQCLNAPYHRWREQFPGLQRTAVEAARAAHARLVSFENVYMYGAPGAWPFVEGQAFAPCADKGRVRADMATDLDVLRRRGALEVAHVRASDLFGPGMRASALGEEFIGRAVQGKGARGFGNLDAPHTWTFTGDAGATLAAVGLLQGAWGGVFHVPSDRPRSMRDVATALGQQLGRDVPVSSTPGWLLRVIGLVRPEAGAMVEMAYEFEHAFVVADEATRAALGVVHTPFPEALATTVRWFQASSGVRA
jgi:nucleoside-diphosphate-sugar epimerase